MATGTNLTSSIDQALYDNLNAYLHRSEIPSEKQQELNQYTRAFHQIKPQIVSIVQRGAVTQELLGLVGRLQKLQRAIFLVRKANISGWEAKEIDKGSDPSAVSVVASYALSEYAHRWGQDI